MIDTEIELFVLYDPAKSDLSLNMWVNTDGALIKDVFKRIEKIKLSILSEKIFIDTIFTYSYSPNQNLLKLIHPAYYYNPGFFESPDAISEGFFEISDLVEDIMIYVSGNNLRHGEKVVEFSVDSVDVTGDGVHNHVYDLTKEFEVFYEEVSVPLRSGACDDVDNCLGTLVAEGDTLMIWDEPFINVCSSLYF